MKNSTSWSMNAMPQDSSLTLTMVIPFQFNGDLGAIAVTMMHPTPPRTLGV